MNTIGKILIALLRGYKWLISPLFPPSCRYVPTCSEYAMEALERFGAVRGTLMASWRLLRCHPFVRGGYDPVIKDEACPSRAGYRRNSQQAAGAMVQAHSSAIATRR